MKINRTLIFAILVLVLLLPASSASAHHPMWSDEDVTTIDDLTTSLAFYRDLPAEKVHVYIFEGKQGQNFYGRHQHPCRKGA